MAITIRSVLSVAKLVAEPIGWLIKKLGGKKAEPVARAVEETLSRNSKKVVAGITLTLMASLRLALPEHADQIIDWLQTNLPKVLEALKSVG